MMTTKSNVKRNQTCLINNWQLFPNKYAYGPFFGVFHCGVIYFVYDISHCYFIGTLCLYVSEYTAWSMGKIAHQTHRTQIFFMERTLTLQIIHFEDHVICFVHRMDNAEAKISVPFADVRHQTFYYLPLIYVYLSDDLVNCCILSYHHQHIARMKSSANVYPYVIVKDFETFAVHLLHSYSLKKVVLVMTLIS